MKIELPEIRPEERTPLVEALLAIIQVLLDRNQQLEETVGAKSERPSGSSYRARKYSVFLLSSTRSWTMYGS